MLAEGESVSVDARLWRDWIELIKLKLALYVHSDSHTPMHLLSAEIPWESFKVTVVLICMGRPAKSGKKVYELYSTNLIFQNSKQTVHS